LDGQVAVFVEAGAEKHRYVCGRAMAVIKNGKDVIVDIDDIYKKAGKRFKTDEISKAVY